MMRKQAWSVVALAALSMAALPGSSEAQAFRPGTQRGEVRGDDHRHGDHGQHARNGARTPDLRTLRRTAMSLETATDQFARSLDSAFDRGRHQGARRGDSLQDHARQLARAADRFKDRIGDRRSEDRRIGERAVGELFEHARALDRFMDRGRIDRQAQRGWLRVERELDQVARAFGLRNWRSGHDDRFGRGDDRFGRGDEHCGRGDDRFGRGDDRFGRGEDRFGRNRPGRPRR